MQIFEALFLLVVAAALARLIAGPLHPQLGYSTLAITGVALLCLGGMFEGWRWQMYPAYLAFAVLMLAALRKGRTKLLWRALSGLPLVALAALAGLLSHYMPMISLPAPTGPHGVGTLGFSITDPARRERYAPERNRELFVEVWYPADRQQAKGFPVRTLFQELYEGDYNRNSFLFGYLDEVDTHSHIQAPVARTSEGKFPVLLFNHALDFGFTSQNHLLMEHLASHGYVVLGIAHPYQSPKVNLADAGTVFRARKPPDDIVLPRQELDVGIVGTVHAATNDMGKVSDLKSQLYPLSEEYTALPDAGRSALLVRAINSTRLAPFRKWLTPELLEDFVFHEYLKENSRVRYWVEDNQFIAGSLGNLRLPVAGLAEAMDAQRLGVIGMSYGGAVAGEFCKIDSRCDAGANLDGTQWGEHWNQPLRAPFLMLYHDGHEGGNDFAYQSPAADFWDYRIKGSTHTDFTDFAYLWPGLKKLRLGGEIDGMRMMQVLNIIHSGFFDHHLKGKPVPGELFTKLPELTGRRHGVVVQ